MGRRNYLMFFVFSNLISLYTLFCYLVTGTHILETTFQRQESFFPALAEAIKQNPLTLVVHFYCMVAILFVVTLQAFHQKLIHDGITTV